AVGGGGRTALQFAPPTRPRPRSGEVAEFLYGNAPTSEQRAKDREAITTLHETVWHESGLLLARVRRLKDAGEEACDRLVKLVKKTFDEIDESVEERIRGQSQVVERFVERVGEVIEREEAIDVDYFVDSFQFLVDHTKRLVEKEEEKEEPTVTIFEDDKFNDKQFEMVGEVLRRGLGEEGGG
ncbi:hypothetical protein ScalyP_jg6531, partial [Parmales sp. scaly parma]